MREEKAISKKIHCDSIFRDYHRGSNRDTGALGLCSFRESDYLANKCSLE